MRAQLPMRAAAVASAVIYSCALAGAASAHTGNAMRGTRKATPAPQAQAHPASARITQVTSAGKPASPARVRKAATPAHAHKTAASPVHAHKATSPARHIHATRAAVAQKPHTDAKPATPPAPALEPYVASWYYDQGDTACGFHATYGVANKTLPCGTKVTIAYDGHTVVAEVDDRGPYVYGRDFDLGESTAHALGMSGVVEVQAAF